MTLAAAPNSDHPSRRRNLATVDELATEYRQPKSSMYDFLRGNPDAGVLRIGRRILVDRDVFDAFVARHK